MKDDRTKGLIIAFLTFFMWGVFPIYFKFIQDVDATQILAHRIFWSFVLLFLFLFFTKKLKNISLLLSDRKKALALLCTGCLISINWGIFIWAVNLGDILSTSLGYFINPLLSVLLGAIFLKERLSVAGRVSLFLAFLAICVQIYALGRLPFVSLILPTSFAFYGLIRKKIAVPSFEGLFCETALMLPLACAYLGFCAYSGTSAFGAHSTGALLAFSGVITVLPLITFAISTVYLPLSTIGFMQYLSPSMSMLIAVFLYGEELSFYKIFSFSLIWLGLAIVGFDSLKRRKNG
ncbi:EamA family transporter RarD [Campylobacter sp. VBCF_06 NA8]|uniref:EamA family transporter RarD n=1 Tax=Campylobacter sp. VBCF_06 NA8 TaxID=2983822 RepID=UPI0022E9AC8E|nr:EamA family transporter RarD [Campylobacter sp. VBCF_06 NA8]MDA3046114.1 EamA family transporter RarD [Campylobacter sp. VBCF_06 NA8]